MVFSNKIRCAFFSLLRSGIWGYKPNISKLSEEEWQVIYQLANQQTVAGIIVDGIEQLPSDKRPNTITLLNSPIAATNTLNTFVDLVSFGKMTEYYEDGKFKGENKYLHTLEKDLPLYGKIKQ